jgi:hypothetical protein
MAHGSDESVRRVRLPGFLVKDEVGLGTVIGRGISAVGVRPCGGCKRRASALDRRVVLYSRSHDVAGTSMATFNTGRLP